MELSTDLELFEEFTPEELARVQEITEVRTFPKGEVILKQGLPAEAVFIVLSGVVRVTAILSEQDEQLGRDEEVLVRIKDGEVFGELSFITGTPPHLSVIAEDTTTLAVIPQAKLHALINVDAPICRKLWFAITRTVVGRLKETGKELVLARYFMRGR